MNRKKIITIFVIVIVLAGSAAYFGWTLLTNSRSSRADADNTVTLSLQSSTNVASVNDEFIVKVIATQQAANTISLLQAQVRYTTNTLKLVGFDDIANGCNNLKYLQPNTITPPTAAVFTIAKVADIDAQTVTFPTGNFCFSALRFKRIAHATDTNASITLEPIVGAPGVSGTGGQVPLVVDAQKKQVSVAAVRSFNKLTVQAIISTSPVALGAFKVRYSCVAVGATPTSTVTLTRTPTPTPVPCIPTLTTPQNASTFTGANPTFVWSSCAGAGVRYKLDVFAGTTTTPFKSVIQTATSYAFTGQQLPVWVRNTVYSWKVKKCIDTDCVGGTYSTTHTFTYNPPLDVPTATTAPTATLTPTRTPTPTATTAPTRTPTPAACLTLNQTCVSAAGAATGTCCTSLRCTTKDLSGSAEKICKALSSGGGGGGGQLPDVVTVTVAPTATRTPTPVPCIPTLTTPLNASTFTGTNPTFVWSTCAGVGVRYKLDVFAGTSTTPFKSVIQSATSYAFTGQQLPVWVRGTVYSWKVKKCIDTDCVGGTYSATRTFTYNPPLDVPTATSIPTRTPTPTILAACLMLNQACENISGTSLGTCCAGMSCQSTALGSMVDKTCQATTVAAPTATPTVTPRVQPNGGNLTLISAETDGVAAQSGIIDFTSPSTLSKTLNFAGQQVSCSIVTTTDSGEVSGPSLASFPGGSYWVSEKSMSQSATGDMNVTLTYRVVTPDAPAPTPTPTVQPDDENGTPTPTPTRSAAGSPTPTPVLDDGVDPDKVTLRMKVKLQGVNAATFSSQYNRLTFSVAVGGGTLTENTPFISSVFSSRGGGVYEGQVAFERQRVPSGAEYKLLVKGPKHLARRFCMANPSGGFNYFCAEEAGKITLRQGLNTFDFSKVNLLAGDLPIDNAQDGVIDSSDLTIVRQYLGNKQPDVIKVADVNLDGIVDTQDYILIISNTLANEDEQ